MYSGSQGVWVHGELGYSEWEGVKQQAGWLQGVRVVLVVIRARHEHVAVKAGHAFPGLQLRSHGVFDGCTWWECIGE